MILDAGPFRALVSSSDRVFLDAVGFFYGDAVHDPEPQVVDYAIGVSRPRSLRRWIRPQVLFQIDGMRPFDPQPAENAFPMFEWGLNW